MDVFSMLHSHPKHSQQVRPERSFNAEDVGAAEQLAALKQTDRRNSDNKTASKSTASSASARRSSQIRR